MKSSGMKWEKVSPWILLNKPRGVFILFFLLIDNELMLKQLITADEGSNMKLT